MKNWKEIEINDDSLVGLGRKFRRGCGRKNVSKKDREKFAIISARYRTDGYTTQTEVLISDVSASENPIVVMGYGTSVRSFTDKFNEHRGVSESLNRAFEGAATVIRHKLANRASRKS